MGMCVSASVCLNKEGVFICVYVSVYVSVCMALQ